MPPLASTVRCSGSRSITRCGAAGSNSEELAPARPHTWRANSMTAHCMPRQMPKNGTPLLARVAHRRDLALDPAVAEAARARGCRARRRDGAAAPSRSMCSASTQLTSTRASLAMPAVGERLGQALVGVLELDVLAHHGDARLAARRLHPTHDVLPPRRGRSGARRARGASRRCRRAPRGGRRAGTS